MKRNKGCSSSRLALAVVLLCLGGPAQAGLDLDRDKPLGATLLYSVFFSTLLPVTSTFAPDEASEASGKISDESSNRISSADRRRLLQARGDAALFIASDGAYRGAYLEAALRLLKRREALREQADLALAQALLALPAQRL